jgi:hypothetical protein
VAEVVADAAARHVVLKLYRQRRSTEVFDADRYYREHSKRVMKFLPRFQRVLVGDPTATVANVGEVPAALTAV